MPEFDDPAEALSALTAAGAPVLPKETTVLASGMGKVWSGKKADGSLWTLTKLAQDKYAVKL